MLIDYCHLCFCPSDSCHGNTRADQVSEIPHEIFDQRAIAVHDSVGFRSAFCGVTLFSQRFLADQGRIRSVEPLHESARELALVCEGPPTRFLIEKILKRPVCLPLWIEMREDLRHPLPHCTLIGKLSVVRPIMFAEYRDSCEARFIEKLSRLRRVSMNELGSQLHGNAGAGLVQRKNPAPCARRRLEHEYLFPRVLELTSSHQSRGSGSNDDSVDHFSFARTQLSFRICANGVDQP